MYMYVYKYMYVYIYSVVVNSLVPKSLPLKTWLGDEASGEVIHI
jgi:hypothetical protein